MFTASLEDYANQVVDFLEKEMGQGYEGAMKKRLCRQHCKLFESKLLESKSINRILYQGFEYTGEEA